MMLSMAILKEADTFDTKEWNFFLTGGDSNMGQQEVDLTKPDVDWVTDDVWKALGALEKTFGAYFQGLKTHVRNHNNMWSPQPHTHSSSATRNTSPLQGTV